VARRHGNELIKYLSVVHSRLLGTALRALQKGKILLEIIMRFKINGRMKMTDYDKGFYNYTSEFPLEVKGHMITK
jgi:hypothetical protein